MKNLGIAILIIYLILALFSCASPYRCAPSKKSKDYARQWMYQRQDGYWIVTTDSKFRGMKQTIFECKPDSIQLANL